VVVIGVAAHFLSQPRKGTVEYHKARYLDLSRKRFGETRWAGFIRGIGRIIGTDLCRKSDLVELDLLVSAEHEALIRLGYLVEKDYCFTNTVLDMEARWISEGVHQAIPKEHVILGGHGLKDGTTNVLVVIAPLEDIPVWERFIAEADRAPDN